MRLRKIWVAPLTLLHPWPPKLMCLLLTQFVQVQLFNTSSWHHIIIAALAITLAMDPWQILAEAESKKFKYDNRPFATHCGYILWTMPAGYCQHHQDCGCMLAKQTAYYRPHCNLGWGAFPVHKMVSIEWEHQFLQNHPGLVICSSSYGSLQP